MLHVRETLRLYGSVSEVSAEAMERRHMSLKARFRLVRPGPRAAVQVLMAEMKAEIATQQEDICGRNEEDSVAIPTPPAVNASFGQNLHPSGRKYPVWLAMLHWKRCLHRMTVPVQPKWMRHSGGRVQGSRLILSLTEMFDKTSFWCQQAWEMEHLPEHMAKFIRDYLPDITSPDIPAAHKDNLTWGNIQTLCGMVQVTRRADGKEQGPSGHLAVHHVLTISHPGTAGQVPAHSHASCSSKNELAVCYVCHLVASLKLMFCCVCQYESI